MSLQKKIIISFLISSALIAALAIFSYVNFIEIRKDIRYLELSDTLRSKTLQLRRHEKNFLLYQEKKELESVYNYVGQLRTIISDNLNPRNSDKLKPLINKIEEYNRTFTKIGELRIRVSYELGRLKQINGSKMRYMSIVDATFLERPLANAEFLENVLGLKPDSVVNLMLKELHDNISTLRKQGEDILTLSKNLDSSAREKVELVIAYTQKVALILIPLFLMVGLTALVIVSRSAVRQIGIITVAIEKVGKGDFSSLSMPHKQDEVGRLIDAFNKMEADLILRDNEIEKKNEELLQGRKLASLGTLASGVAHELNNPLNNIYLSAQILTREIGTDTCPDIVRETVSDIYSQTLRVKRIVGDLLAFAREKPPEVASLNIAEVIAEILARMATAGDLRDIRHNLQADDVPSVLADRHMMEQVFINLFTNAVDAMDGKGALSVSVRQEGPDVRIAVSDNGKGIPREQAQRIFDPFFTTKEQGTGLGLSIVYSIIEKHKGKIEVKSTVGEGTTFLITLPGEK